MLRKGYQSTISGQTKHNLVDMKTRVGIWAMVQ